MTKTQQHQEQIKHAKEQAEEAIMTAQRAEEMLNNAWNQANPKQIQSSRALLSQTQQVAIKAEDQMGFFNKEHKYDAQLAQVSEKLHQAQEDIEQTLDETHMPKQVR
jgi:hypothetical protein